MTRFFLFFLVSSPLAACGGSSPSLAFPTGVYQVAFQETSSTCGADIQTDPQSFTIDTDDDGTYVLTAFGGQVPAASQSAQHLTFVLAPSDATIGQCDYSETDTLTLTASGQNFTGTAAQNFTGGTCTSCGIQQSLSGTKTSD